MLKVIAKISSLFLLTTLSVASFAQQSSGRLDLKNSAVLDLTLEIKNTITQEAMGKAINFTVTGLGKHSYLVTDSGAGGYELHHDIQRFNFQLDGMGQKRSFDSDKKADLDGPYGIYFKDLLGRSFDVHIDSTGKVLEAKPDSIDHGIADEEVAVVTGLLKELTGIVDPPRKGSFIFFDALPTSAKQSGYEWKDSIVEATSTTVRNYKVKSVTDSLIIVSFESVSNTISESSMMGGPTTIKLKTSSKGDLHYEASGNLLLMKTIQSESTGTTIAMGKEWPLNAKTTMLLRIKRH